MFDSEKRRQRDAVRFLELVVVDALDAPSTRFRKPRRRPRAIVRQDGSVVCERCTVADSPLPRMRGLLGRSGLSADEGLLLRPAGSIHTFFMRFPIDAVFLDRQGRVVRVARSIRPWRAAAARGARSVLELRAGECDRRRLQPGDVLEIDAA
ncbi:MAG TPA: DUF192 domain-containing protein [Gaiellaceae bacterium]|jgi:hypothetical protein